MSTDAEDDYERQTTAFWTQELENNYAFAQDSPFYKELRQFLAVERGLNISDDAFEELFRLVYNWHESEDPHGVEVPTGADKIIIGQKHIKLTKAAKKMLAQMKLHAKFLDSVFMFYDEELAAVRKTLEMIENLKRQTKQHYTAETRDNYIVRLAEWWKRSTKAKLTYNREGAPFVRLCKNVMPSSGTSYGTVRRALEEKKKIKDRDKSAVPERKKHRAVGT